MTNTTTRPAATGPATPDRYSLGRSPEEHARLRAQARFWEEATRHLLDQVGVPRGGRCLDAGCGPGETMRLLADRVEPDGSVLGIDVDAPLLAETRAALHADGHLRSDVRVHDLTGAGPVPGAPFDLVFARLLLLHLPERVAVLARLWDAVAPGGVLVIQDYDLRAASALPPVRSLEELLRIIIGAFEAAGADPAVGSRLPGLFVQAGVGDPDATDVAGRLTPLATGGPLVAGIVRSLLPGAVANGVTTEEHARTWLDALDRDIVSRPDAQVQWPLMVGAWKRREPA